MNNEIKEKIKAYYMGNDIDKVLDYITNLQEKVNQYENPDDMTLFYMWLDEKAKDKMKELQTTVNNCKERIAYLERSNNRREDTIISLRMDITNSEDIIYKLEKYLEEKMLYAFKNEIGYYKEILDKLKELKENK